MNKELKNKVIIGSRGYGINMTLFRHIIGEKLGVNVTDMECLALLFHKGIATPSELGEYTGLTSGATTAMLDRLEKAQLIIRKPNPNDRRGTLIQVNTKGAAKAAPLFDSIRKAQEDLLSEYSERELNLLEDFFEKSGKMWEDERKKLKR